MNAKLKSEKESPFQILGLTQDASEQEIRSRYLELVKEFPPDQNAERFREIQAAYEAARDPLVLADILIKSSNPEDPPSWQSVIDQQAKRPPQMSANFLLSLGNRAPNYRPPAEPAAPANEAST